MVEPEFKTLLDYYLESETLEEFSTQISSIDEVSDVKTIANNLKTYLQDCRTTTASPKTTTAKFKASFRHIERHYTVKGKAITIFYNTDLVEKTLHPALAHLETKQKSTSDAVVFDVYLDGNKLCLFKNQTPITSVAKRNYHLMQGKFIIELLSVIYGKEESDWIGTFHGSTISDGNNSILFIGKSGKGKSTLCALLAANGYELLADDVSPMLSENSTIFHNPSAISIKEGAFGTLQPLIPDFDDLPSTLFNTTKGPLKYIPCRNPKKDSYACKAIIMVNYEPGSQTLLEPASIKDILETLIPDSWLSNHPLHAEQFLDWLASTQLYELTYSDTNSVIETISTVFGGFKDC